MITAKEEFYYGALRSMKQEYLIRTITKAIPNAFHVEITNRYDTPLGDDKVEITSYVDEEVPVTHYDGLDDMEETEYETVTMQVNRDTYLSCICYEVAKILACEY